MGITVAIVTARKDEDTTYKRWASVRNAVLAGRETWVDEETGAEVALGKPPRRPPVFSGELGAVLATVFCGPVNHHVEFQIRALLAGTVIPDEIIVVSRTHQSGTDESVTWVEPMVSTMELIHNPVSGMFVHPQMEEHPLRRRRDVSYGCSDKNTALLFASHDNIIFLDDCCLPGLGFVENALKVCEQGNVLLPFHRMLYLPSSERNTFEFADSNSGPEGHSVFGILASPIKYLLDINGWNTELDGQRGGLDAELKIRMDRYLKMREKEYVYCPFSRVYEIEHSYPWGMSENQSDEEWKEVLPKGYIAPGPNLRELRSLVVGCLPPDDDESALENAIEDFIDKRLTELLNAEEEGPEEEE